MIIFDTNKHSNWTGRGLAINKTGVVAYKNANFRHPIQLKKGRHSLRVFAKNRTGSGPIFYKIITGREVVLSHGKITLSKNWSENEFLFELKKNYGTGYLLFYRQGSSFGSVEIGRLTVNREEIVEVPERRRLTRSKPSSLKPLVLNKAQPKSLGIVVPYGIYGGAEIYIKEILNNLSSNFFKVHVLYLKDNPLTNMVQNKRVIHKKISSSQNFKNYVNNQKINYLVYYNSVQAYKLVTAAAKEASHAVKLVEIYHSDFKWADSLANLKSRRGVDIVFKTSPRLLKGVGGFKSHIHLPVPIDIEKFSIKEYDEGKSLLKDIPSSNAVLGVVARLSPEKNLDYVLDLAKASSDKFTYLLFGRGPYEKQLRARIAKENIRNVRFMGFKKDMFRYYSSLDGVVLTSKMEGTPISLLEAMASGIPVFTTNVGEISSIIKDNETGYFLTGKVNQDIDIIFDGIYIPEVPLAARNYIEEHHDSKSVASTFASSLIDINNLYTKKTKDLISGEYI